ncbi:MULTISPECIES: hypothetical protein [Methanothermobacter]|uniref:hypothetical protein n=1 Tax=Methanothermobacter TaxID=145260 RepID=UPI001365B97D|nr:hypothetical protein [Methanothermobacter sp. THM-2]QHN07537.1 hypothetical protein FZP68_01350 [Methanothermobacter sp. THM-2]
MRIGKLTVIDIAIILFLASLVLYGFLKTSDIDSNIQTFTFDSSEMTKVQIKYNDLYSKGKIIKSKINGYNSLTQKRESIYGEVLWIGTVNGRVEVLMNVNGEKVLAGEYQDKFADYYIDSITLEATGSQNATDIILEPIKISRMSDLLLDIPSRYEMTTNIPIRNMDVSRFQELSRELYSREKHVPITLNIPNGRIEILQATPEAIKIANELLGDVNGQTDFITVRVYNADGNVIEKIKRRYRVIKVINVSRL